MTRLPCLHEKVRALNVDPRVSLQLALADCHFDGHKNLSDGGKMWGNLSRHTWITWPPKPKLDPGGERELVTWIKLQVSKVPQTRFCWLCRVCPPIFTSKTPKPGKPVPWKRLHTTPTPSHPKCQAKAISCNLATCGNELSREVRPLFSLSKSWLGPFPFLQLGCFPPLWGAN